MSDILFSYLLQRSVAAQRFIALALTVATALFVVLIIYFISLNIIAAANERQQLREMVGNLQRIADQKEMLETAAASSQNPTALLGQNFIEGETTAIALANLQGKLVSIAQANQVVVTSAGNARARNIGGLDQIGINANLSGTMEAIHNTLLALEASSPPLFIDGLAVRMVQRSAQVNQTEPVELSTQLQIYGTYTQNETVSGQGDT